MALFGLRLSTSLSRAITPLSRAATPTTTSLLSRSLSTTSPLSSNIPTPNPPDWSATPNVSKHPVRKDDAAEEPIPMSGRERAVTMEKAMGDVTSEVTWINAYTDDPIKRYRVMDLDGEILEGAHEPEVGKSVARKMYTNMLRLNIMDGYLYDVQRQGRISFYMTNYGEEASHIGSAAALDLQDMVFGQYREAGVLMWRGFEIQQFTDQCYSNKDDMGRGRQMPVHYGSKDLHFQTISSPLGTQIPQATGYAYAMKHTQPHNCTVCYFGDGAASEGDFHAALNSAATLDCPVIFFCRNNQYAISTSVDEQYRGDGIASRGTGYGIDAVRVDGNDVWAVYNVMKKARQVCIEEQRPILIEAMSYRIGHHSTSDDSTRYRSLEEIEFWREENDPIQRFKRYLTKRDWWTEEEDVEFRRTTSRQVIDAIKSSEAKAKPPITDMFLDVYEELPPHLKEQQDELNEFLEVYGKHYKLGQFEEK